MDYDIKDIKLKMEQVLNHLHDELNKIRAGRANSAMLDSVVVKAYGQEMPLKHVANIIAADSQMLQITPFDPNNLGVISNAISESSLGLNPSDDGHVVRVAIPPLNEERRKELVKTLGEKTEDSKVAIRNIRHENLKDAKSAQQKGEVSEDDYHRLEKEINEAVEEFNKKIDESAKVKETEIMTV